jgi:hypothetical protein
MRQRANGIIHYLVLLQQPCVIASLHRYLSRAAAIKHSTIPPLQAKNLRMAEFTERQ